MKLKVAAIQMNSVINEFAMTAGSHFFQKSRSRKISTCCCCHIHHPYLKKEITSPRNI